MKANKNALIFSTAAVILIIDHITKFFVIHNFKDNESLPVIKNIFHLTFVTNSGTAFGLFRGINLFFILLSIAVAIILVYSIRKIKEKDKAMQFAVGLLLGGTLGNLMDRIVHGFVIDFLDFQVWPVFNIADSAISIGVAILIISVWRK